MRIYNNDTNNFLAKGMLRNSRDIWLPSSGGPNHWVNPYKFGEFGSTFTSQMGHLQSMSDQGTVVLQPQLFRTKPLNFRIGLKLVRMESPGRQGLWLPEIIFDYKMHCIRKHSRFLSGQRQRLFLPFT